jgi:tetratricopeptide (TPR) repeat protein
MHTRFAIALIALIATGTAHAKFMQPVPAPVDRLIANLERQLTNRGGDADLHYRRGRLYALSAVQKEAHIRGNAEIDFTILSANDAVLAAPASDVTRAALKTSIESYRAALKLKPDHALSHLGLGWALEASAKLKVPGAELKDALASYKKAFELAQPEDGKRTEQPLSMTGLKSLLSYEAGEAYVRAAESGGGDAAFVKTAKDHLGKLGALPRPSKVTPIIFSKNGKGSLEKLRDPSRCSTFDLDASGMGQCWEWLTPNAGILVWDPSGKGEVKNGWQLFGSVSFFLFFEHGYEALELLDDDGDGWLAGQELDGLAVWTDLDRDGQPRASEVKPVRQEKIRRISVQPVFSRGVWQQPRGLELTNGATRPTWDWVTHPRVMPAFGAQK